MAGSLRLRDPSKDVIGASTLRTTWISGIVAALLAVGTSWDSLWKTVYNTDPSPAVKTAVLITILAAWAAIAIADMAVRAYATAHTSNPPEPGGPWQVTPLAAAAEATLTQKEGTTLAVVVVASRVDARSGETIQFLILVPNGSAEWVDSGSLAFTQ